MHQKIRFNEEGCFVGTNSRKPSRADARGQGTTCEHHESMQGFIFERDSQKPCNYFQDCKETSHSSGKNIVLGMSLQ